MSLLHLALVSFAAAGDVPLDLTLTEVVAPDEGSAVYFPDLIVTDDGTVHVLLAENFSDELRYTRHAIGDADGVWSAPEVVSTVSDSGPFNLELRLDADGRVAAVFDPGPGDVLGVARLDDLGAWSVTTLGSGARWFDLLFTADGVMHGAYSTGALWYASDAAGGWNPQTVRQTGIFEERYPYLIDEGGEVPAVAFVDRADFSNPAVRIARSDAGVWGFEEVTDAGEGPLGFARDDDGTLHAVFRRAGEANTYAWVWARDDGSGWVEAGDTLPSDRTGVGEGSHVDVHRLGDELLWADADGGLRFVLAGADGWRTFVQALPVEARTVRLERDGDRLLALVGTDDSGVYLASLSLDDGDADGVPAAFDACPDLADPDQADADEDGVGDACDCGDDGLCTAWTDEGGVCDGSTPALTDPDCDLCAIGPDADGDGVTDACDLCPNDPDKDAPGACGCGEVDADPCGEVVVDEGCGCATGPAGGGIPGLALLALGLVARRRR